MNDDINRKCLFSTCDYERYGRTKATASRCLCTKTGLDCRTVKYSDVQCSNWLGTSVGMFFKKYSSLILFLFTVTYLIA